MIKSNEKPEIKKYYTLKKVFSNKKISRKNPTACRETEAPYKNKMFKNTLFKNETFKDTLFNITSFKNEAFKDTLFNMTSFKNVSLVAVSLVMASLVFSGCGSSDNGVKKITNVSYDPTRELYENINPLFEKDYEEKYGEQVEVVTSHGGSGAQARSVVEGCNADVVTLALEHDISLIERTGLIDAGWKDEYADNSAPYTSTIVFLVRKGNPLTIKDWNDLVEDGVEVITPDPKSSGGACWNFFAALSYAKARFIDEAEQKEFMKKLYGNVSVMDSGARGSTTTFVENEKGDVLISWENEAIATIRSYPDEYEMVTPSVSILAEPSVAIVDDNVKSNKTEKEADEYIKFLYTKDAQKIIAENGYRPVDKDVLNEFADSFDMSVELSRIEDFGGWDKAYKDYFDEGAYFDEIYE